MYKSREVQFKTKTYYILVRGVANIYDSVLQFCNYR
jgi:hypothetical protein